MREAIGTLRAAGFLYFYIFLWGRISIFLYFSIMWDVSDCLLSRCRCVSECENRRRLKNIQDIKESSCIGR